MADLKLDMERLSQLKSDLESVVSEFKNADDFSDDVADATGQDELAGKVREFASGWNDKRKKMLGDVEELQKEIAAITDGFTKVNSGLAKALESSDKGTGAAGDSGSGRTGGPRAS